LDKKLENIKTKYSSIQVHFDETNKNKRKAYEVLYGNLQNVLANAVACLSIFKSDNYNPDIPLPHIDAVEKIYFMSLAEYEKAYKDYGVLLDEHSEDFIKIMYRINMNLLNFKHRKSSNKNFPHDMKHPDYSKSFEEVVSDITDDMRKLEKNVKEIVHKPLQDFDTKLNT